ncbi:MAG: type II toxin-antitoxin system Phd/YefM family antitoxin [Caldilineaceae bacterium]
MTQISAAEAATKFDQLLNKVRQGQEVTIIGTDGAAFKLVALPRTPKPRFGSARGLVRIGPDFDEPLEGLEEYMP